MWAPLRNTIRKAAVAAANLVIREGEDETTASTTVGARVRGRLRRMTLDAPAKMAISLSAQRLARMAARALPDRGLGRLARGLARRPLAASGVALFAFDAARDGVRLGRGHITSQEFVERASGNALGLASSAGGAVVGGALGGLVIPVVGAPIGSFVGGMVAGVGGDAAGRRLARRVTGRGSRAA